jgi:hypothetical protein
MATQTHNEAKNGKGVYECKPVEWDHNVEPDAAAGQYVATLEDVTFKPTKDGYPMLRLDWQLNEAVDGGDAQEKSIGATVSDWITFFPSGEKKGRMGKIKYRQVCELLNVDLDIVPGRIDGKASFLDFIKDTKGQQATIFVALREDPSTGEMRTNVNYTAPRGAMVPLGSSGAEDDGGDAPQERHNRPARNSKPARNGKSARR